MMCLFKKLDHLQKNKIVSVNYSHAMFSCLSTSKPFGDAGLGLVHSGSTLHMQISDNLTYLSTIFKEKTSSCIQAKTGI
jgi:hypothetical protein